LWWELCDKPTSWRGTGAGSTAAGAGEAAVDAAPPACEGELEEEKLEDDPASEACVKGKVRPSGLLDLTGFSLL
jgi:hypothetical protein